MEGYVHSWETFGSVDGPGVRFVIFLAGCPMRCQYCHNPDTWNMRTGHRYSAQELIAKAERYRPYWRGKGGITISGGEPLMQLDFLIELCKLARERGIHVAVDTSGILFQPSGPTYEKLEVLLQYVDLFLLDIKHIEDQPHQQLTGHSNQAVLAFAQYLSKRSKPVWIRHVLVPSRNDDRVSLERLGMFIKSLNNVEKVEVLPYHTMGITKWESLGMNYPLPDIEPPSEESLKQARKILGAE